MKLVPMKSILNLSKKKQKKRQQGSSGFGTKPVLCKAMFIGLILKNIIREQSAISVFKKLD